MTFSVEMPNLTSEGAVTLPTGETALTVALKTFGALAQVSGVSAGFDLFTPTASCTYLLAIRVQDVATGAPSNATLDIVSLTTTGTWVPQKDVTSVALVGTCATTYTKNSSALKVAVATGITWYVDVMVLARFPA